MEIKEVVIALVKLENLKAIHNTRGFCMPDNIVVIALVKLENLKAIHNTASSGYFMWELLLH